MNGPDVLWDGVPHQKIVEWVSRGPGAALTEQMDARLKSAAEALSYTSNLVNTAIQRAGGDWQGSAADAATEAMRVLRNFDDGMHFTSNIASIRAFGQSDGASFVRANVPQVVEVKPPNPTGGLIDIISATMDYQNQQAAAKQAEQRAREIMQQYTEATRERVAAMPPLTPVPQVVLDISPSPKPPIVEPPPRPRDPGDGPRERGPVQDADGGAGPAQRGPAQPDPTSPSVTPGPTRPAVAPGPGSPPGGCGLLALPGPFVEQGAECPWSPVFQYVESRQR